MSCYHPLNGLVIGTNSNGKKNIRVVNSEFKNRFSELSYIDIPCGKCIGCRLDYSRQWADRCMLEAQYHEKNCFITLTYDNDNLPPAKEFIDNTTGEIRKSNIHPLVKKDFQDFMKRLRDRVGYDTPIRYYACGEYGSESFRPHYHAIIFGYNFDNDRVFYKKNFRGDIYYKSDFLDSVWNNGITMVADLEWDCCAYVARYVAKKLGNKLDYAKYDIPKEFVVMSRRPGIARQFYDDNKETLIKDKRIYLSTDKGSKRIHTPRYYEKLFDIDFPKENAEIKNDNIDKMINHAKILDESSSKSHLGILEDMEVNFTARTNIFKERSDI